ncbi:putative pilin subunit [Candidatus Terasakiella magnetica]|uniref:Putative pilin subunit n=1 Tax=Candidatus Terasakiella magnetica TaxID=1867952 RepID=A0A1C3REN2_9PROT|nr:Flp family type IVb pilin [Candidatus Terasakiella magnetica]SCA55719.1 putative pilin subunit [Candidatus Terasakiella magnetica]
MFATIKNIWNDESGATAIEYGLIAALISVVAITGMNLVGTGLNTAFTGVSTELNNAVTSESTSTSTETTTETTTTE